MQIVGILFVIIHIKGVGFLFNMTISYPEYGIGLQIES